MKRINKDDDSEIDISEMFLISCRDFLLHDHTMNSFFPLRRLMSKFNLDYEEFAKRIALMKEFGHDNEYWYPILKDALSRGQIKSKIWLLKEAKKYINFNDKIVYLLGGWIGILAFLLLWHTSVKKIRNIELDNKSVEFSDWLLITYVIQDHKFKAFNYNMIDINYELQNWDFVVEEKGKQNYSDSADIIINTSCDHLTNFSEWWDLVPKGKEFIIQNNNFPDIEDHYNYVESLEKFISQVSDTSEIYYSGELETEKYTRYMIIGKK